MDERYGITVEEFLGRKKRLSPWLAYHEEAWRCASIPGVIAPRQVYEAPKVLPEEEDEWCFPSLYEQ